MKNLIGKLRPGKGYQLAGKRLKDCEKILNKYEFFFPPLFFGSLNIDLCESFSTPETGIIHISQAEIDEVAPGYAEWWNLIPIVSINNQEMSGFIYRTQQHVHGDSVIELVTENLNEHNINLTKNLSVGIKL